MTEDLQYRLVGVSLEEKSSEGHGREVEHERQIALYDLLETNFFRPIGSPGGPYNLLISLDSNRLTFTIYLINEERHGTLMLSLTPFRKVIKDYFEICDSYFKAIPNQPQNCIEAIDMARRGLHDEGAHILKDRFAGKIDIDFDTARRLFTLICVLHLKG
jgi:uncharacterized protein (UPF0262 family)